MDKIISTRLDESVVHLIRNLANSLHLFKKSVIEKAVCAYAKTVQTDNLAPFLQTFGSWNRKESADKIIDHSKQKFQKSMRRHQS